jgi:hypothetical protein
MAFEKSHHFKVLFRRPSLLKSRMSFFIGKSSDIDQTVQLLNGKIHRQISTADLDKNGFVKKSNDDVASGREHFQRLKSTFRHYQQLEKRLLCPNVRVTRSENQGRPTH